MTNSNNTYQPLAEQQWILLAEDDEEDAELFVEIVAEVATGIPVQRAKNGVVLMNLLAETTALPRLVFLDLNMPLKNGMSCLAEIRADSRLQGLTVIVLSTSENPAQMEAVRSAGANYYLVKPTSYIEFRRTMTDCLTRNWHGTGTAAPTERRR